MYRNWQKCLAMMVALLCFVSSFILSSFETAYADPSDPYARYVTPTGAGTKDGTSWDNAFEGNKTGGLQYAWDNTLPNGTLYIGSGNYDIVQSVTMSTSGASFDSMKKLIGKDTGGGLPVFTGDWKINKQNSSCLIHIPTNVKNIWIESIKIRNYRIGIYAQGQNSALRVYDIDINGVNRGIFISGGGVPLGDNPDTNTNSNDIIIKGCNIKNFTEYGMLLRDGVYFTRVMNSTVDAGGAAFWRPDSNPVGFQVSSVDQAITVREHGIVFIECIARNNYHNNGSGVWEGNGFAAESKAYDITYNLCKALDNTGSGWHDKSKNPTLVDCVSFRNGRNYSLQTQETAALVRCIGAYAQAAGGTGTAYGLWVGDTDADSSTPGGYVEAYNCTFHNNANAQVYADGGNIRLFRSIVSTTLQASVLYKTMAGNVYSTIEAYSTHEYKARELGSDPKYVNGGDFSWDGEGKDFNSKLYGSSKGYYYRGTKDAELGTSEDSGLNTPGLLTGIPTSSGDRYVTPMGAGAMDGTSWANALPGNIPGALQTAWNATDRESTLFIGSGNYDSAVSVSVTTVVYADSTNCGLSVLKPKRMVGVDTGGGLPVFTGIYKLNDRRSCIFFDLKDGADYIWVQNIVANNFLKAVNAFHNHRWIRLFNVDADTGQSCLHFENPDVKSTSTKYYNTPDAASKDVVIMDCDIKNYALRGVRFRYGNSNVRLINNTADGGGYNAWIFFPDPANHFMESFTVGHSDNPAKVYDYGFVYVDCNGSNNWHEDLNGIYWNADGFANERKSHNIVYLGCKAFDNTDGGWDDKSSNPTLIDCVSMRNKRNYRFWSINTAVLSNCLGAYAYKNGHPFYMNPETFSGGGLWGQYYGNMYWSTSSSGLKTSRVDSTVYFDYGTGVPSGTSITTANSYSIRWQGLIKADCNENYTFYVKSKDGSALYINGTKLFDNTASTPYSEEASGSITLEAGKIYSIKLDMVKKTIGNGICELSWSSSSIPKEKIPATHMAPTILDGNASYGIWAGGSSGGPYGRVEAYGSTFHNNAYDRYSGSSSTAAQIGAEGGNVRLHDSIVSEDSQYPIRLIFLDMTKPNSTNPSSKVELFDTEEYLAGIKGNNPQYVNGSNWNWNGDGIDFDNMLYTSTKGYYYRGALYADFTCDPYK